MNYKKYNEWLLLQIDKQYHLKTIREFLDDFIISDIDYWLTQIQLNKMPVKEGTYLKEGDTLQIKAFPKEEIDFECSELPIEVAYEDDFILVVNKPRDMIIYPAAKKGNDTLCNLVATYYRDKDIHCAIRPIHRLDKETTGLVLFCKSPFLQAKLDKMLFKKDIHRYYYAFVEGLVEADGKIDKPIGKDRHVNNKYRIDKFGKTAVTRYRVVRTMKNFSLLECTLETGRTHQIRVHLASIGHPIVNDQIYGEPFDNLEMGLQAYRINFDNPITNKNIDVQLKCLF